MWSLKEKVIPLIIGVTRTISKSLRQYLNNIRGKHGIKELQKKTATVHVLWKVQNIFHGRNNIMCSKNCKYRTAAILYTLEMWFVSGI